MARYSGHREGWGRFVDAKANLPEVLERQVRRLAPAAVVVGSVTDPYQPAEERHRLTRRALEILTSRGFPVDLLTKSPLVLRDLDLLTAARGLSVGITVTSQDEAIRAIFEPGAPSYSSRLEALATLSGRGVDTFAFAGPLLPADPAALARELARATGTVYLDRMNYPRKTADLFRRAGLARWLDPSFADAAGDALVQELEGRGLRVVDLRKK
jgi:DNA repair photolyase